MVNKNSHTQNESLSYQYSYKISWCAVILLLVYEDKYATSLVEFMAENFRVSCFVSLRGMIQSFEYNVGKYLFKGAFTIAFGMCWSHTKWF